MAGVISGMVGPVATAGSFAGVIAGRPEVVPVLLGRTLEILSQQLTDHFGSRLKLHFGSGGGITVIGSTLSQPVRIQRAGVGRCVHPCSAVTIVGFQ